MKHAAYLILGTNIEPEKNTIEAAKQLDKSVDIIKNSSTWETIAVGSDGPNFLNTAIYIETEHNAEKLKRDLINHIEYQLGRVRTSDKNAARTIDIDIVIFDGVLYDQNLWKKAFVAIPMAELLPDLKHPTMNLTLSEFIRQFEGKKLAVPHPLKIEDYFS
jgi:2-amino-4-hydroxy-6-hydroxymethyldihydropteridine diphosphokinase